MEIVHTIPALQSKLNELRANGKSVGLVPTMGALHEGHLSLIRRCRAENDVAIVSVFVNPTQFNNPTDLATYPRDLDADAALVNAAGVDLLFAPSPDDIYSKEEMERPFLFDFEGLDQVMEGKQRPGHFNGVVQIVSKLFRLINPTNAYFGEKDFQQVAVIRLMVKTMRFDINIIACPIIREESGLAKSSRNQLLNPEQKVLASNIFKVLKESLKFAPEKNPAELTRWVTDHINEHEGLEVEYFEIVDGTTLQTVNSWNDADSVVGCVTVHCGHVRLIDNIKYKG